MSCGNLTPVQQNNPPSVPGCANDECKVSPPRRNVERVRDPTPEPIIKRCVKRNPTPPGDVIERVRVTRQPQTIIERVTEQPRKPQPKIIERIENEPAPPPIIRNTCVFVDPTPRPEQAAPRPLCLSPQRTSPPPKAPTPAPKSPSPSPKNPSPVPLQCPPIKAPTPPPQNVSANSC